MLSYFCHLSSRSWNQTCLRRKRSAPRASKAFLKFLLERGLRRCMRLLRREHRKQVIRRRAIRKFLQELRLDVEQSLRKSKELRIKQQAPRKSP